MEKVINKNSIGKLLVEFNIKRDLNLKIYKSGQFILNAAAGKYLELKDIDFVEFILKEDSFYINKSDEQNGFRIAKHSAVEKYSWRLNNRGVQEIIKHIKNIKDDKTITVKLIVCERKKSSLHFKELKY